MRLFTLSPPHPLILSPCQCLACKQAANALHEVIGSALHLELDLVGIGRAEDGVAVRRVEDRVREAGAFREVGLVPLQVGARDFALDRGRFGRRCRRRCRRWPC